MIPYLIAGAIGFVVAKIFDEDEAPKYEDGGSVLLAPNGKPSNLTPEQYKLVRTPAFKKWFGDWENSPETASKVVDENGEPLMVFHATNNDFNVFDEKYIGSSNDRGFYGKGFYFTFQSEFKDMKYAINEANYYGGKLLNCYIKAFNPFDLSNLKMYKNKKISYIGANSLVFLYNIAVLFPQIADKIFLEKNIYNKFSKEYDVEEVPISILPNLISKYANDLKYIETKTQQDIKETMGYVKSEIVKYDYTESGGTKGEFTSYDELGRVPYDISKEEKEILFIEIAIEKYDGISIRLQPEGYMTRNSIITDAIKEKHDCILQSKYGDELVVFQPNQIKLADGTNTTFDGNNPDIRFAGGGKVDVVDIKQYNIGKRNYRFVEIAEKKYNKIELYRQADDGNYYGQLLYRRVPRYDAKFSSPMVNDMNQLYAYEPVSNEELFNAVKNKTKPFASFGYWLSYYTEEEIQKEIQSFIYECDKYDLEYAVEKISGENKSLERIRFQVCQKGTFDELFDINALIEDYANNDFDSYDIEKIEEFRYVELSYFLNNEWDEHYALTGLILGIPPKFTMALINMWTSYGLAKDYKYDNEVIIM